jgi:hypothetical protein
MGATSVGGAGKLSAAHARSIALRKALANVRAADLAPIIAELQASGITTLRGIASELTRRGVPTALGRRWHAQTVNEVLRRLRETVG